MFKSVIWVGAPLVLIAAFTLPALAGGQDGPDHNGPPPRPTFSDIDTNKDGVISQAEFDAFRPTREKGPHDGKFHRHGPPDLKALDTNGDGKVTFEEFSAPMKTHFDRLDTNHDGVLSGGELTPVREDGPPPPPPEK
jgi:hypothetical protein